MKKKLKNIKHRKREDLRYQTNKYACNFQRFETIRSFQKKS